jgi:hypothetical protein
MQESTVSHHYSEPVVVVLVAVQIGNQCPKNLRHMLQRRRVIALTMDVMMARGTDTVGAEVEVAEGDTMQAVGEELVDAIEAVAVHVAEVRMVEAPEVVADCFGQHYSPG